MQTAVINATASGTNKIVSGVANRRIRVLGFTLSFSGTVNAQFQDSASNNLSGIHYGVADTQVVAPIAPPVVGSQVGWFIAAAGADLDLNLSAAVTVGGTVVYDFTS